MLLRENDPRSVNLRKKYVFKIIPMLNPDGVFRGHYRTDSRGINLNRVYGAPDPVLHPQIYYAKRLVLFSHQGFINDSSNNNAAVDNNNFIEPLNPVNPPPPNNLPSNNWLDTGKSPVKSSSSEWYEMTETSRCSEGDESIADFSLHQSTSGYVNNSTATKVQFMDHEENAFLPAASASGLKSFAGAFSTSSSDNGNKITSASKKLNFENNSRDEKNNLEDNLAEKLNKAVVDNDNNSNLFLYVDIHGHASKRGIFMYGNHFDELDKKVECMLLPKLMSINCANFDFPACNFTQRNMYLKDRHTGAGKEGCGRVSVFKSTGLTYSYTLEANFNTGRVVNGVPMASRDFGRASPPPMYDRPPKYTPLLYEDSGKAMAVSILDLTESNPWSRLTCSNCKNLRGVKESIRKFIKTAEEAAAEKEKAANGGRAVTAPAATTTSRLLRRRTTSIGSAKSSLKKSSPRKSIENNSGISGKTPVSPDSYRPVTKIPRKSSLSKLNLPAAAAPADSSAVGPKRKVGKKNRSISFVCYGSDGSASFAVE